MSGNEQRIDVNLIRRLALKEFKFNRSVIQKKPNEELTASMLVVIGNLFDNTTWKIHKLVFPVFDEHRYEILERVAKEYAKQQEPLVAVILSTKAWVSQMNRETYERKPEERIQPRLDPNRKEMLMCAALTLDLQGVFISEGFKRNDKGVPIFEGMNILSKEAGTYENKILEAFVFTYAKAIASRKI